MFQTKLTVYTEEEVITLWHEPYGEPGGIRLYISEPGAEVKFEEDTAAVLLPQDLDNLIAALQMIRERVGKDPK